jgi:hypothetical protein
MGTAMGKVMVKKRRIVAFQEVLERQGVLE